MISLRDHGLLERAQVQVTGDYTEQQLALSYNAIISGVVTGGIAAIEAVAGRVAALLSVAQVSGGPRAAQALTPTVLAMIGRNLIEAGESLHAVKVRRTGEVYLCPAQRHWTVLGGIDPEAWIINATLTGAMTVAELQAPRAAWLHVVKDADPDYPWRGVSALQRAAITTALARTARGCAASRGSAADQGADPAPAGRGHRPGHAAGRHPERGVPDRLPDHHRGRVRRRAHVRAGRRTGSRSDSSRCRTLRSWTSPTSASPPAWSPHSARTRPSWAAARGNGSVDREAHRQMRKQIMQPMARLIEENAYRAFGERIRIWWEPGVDALLVKTRAADVLGEDGRGPAGGVADRARDDRHGEDGAEACAAADAAQTRGRRVSGAQEPAPRSSGRTNVAERATRSTSGVSFEGSVSTDKFNEIVKRVARRTACRRWAMQRLESFGLEIAYTAQKITSAAATIPFKVRPKVTRATMTTCAPW